MDLAEELRSGLEEEIRESGSRVTAVGPLSWELRSAPEKRLLHLWAENCNLTRRIVAINDHSAERLALSVEHKRGRQCDLGSEAGKALA